MTQRTAELGPDRWGAARSVFLVFLLLATLAVGGVGLAKGLQLLAHRSEHAAELALAAPSRGDLRLGEQVRTSFGALVASAAEVNNGLSSQELGGMSHGVSALVSTGRAQIEVAVTLSNTGHGPVLVGADQFRLVTHKGPGPWGPLLKPSGTTLMAGPLPAGASVDTRISFVVPTDGAAMSLVYRDPGRPEPVRIALGRTDRILARPDHVH